MKLELHKAELQKKEYIRNLRVEKERELLVQTSRSINVISNNAGYIDQKAFS